MHARRLYTRYTSPVLPRTAGSGCEGAVPKSVAHGGVPLSLPPGQSRVSHRCCFLPPPSGLVSIYSCYRSTLLTLCRLVPFRGPRRGAVGRPGGPPGALLAPAVRRRPPREGRPLAAAPAVCCKTRPLVEIEGAQPPNGPAQPRSDSGVRSGVADRAQTSHELTSDYATPDRSKKKSTLLKDCMSAVH